jgi:hypothetical protein
MAAVPQVSFADLPDTSQRQMAFYDSTWFRTHGLTHSLPTPDQVRARCPGSDHYNGARAIAKFEELDLIVKFGQHVTISEAVCLKKIDQLFSKQVPVPEVYGWRVDNQIVFLYMQLVRGPTLLERWSTMNYQDKYSVCGHLRLILQTLRITKQDPFKTFIGKNIF